MLWLIGLYVVNSLAVLAVAVRSARRPAEALTWALICMVAPLVGTILYAAVSRRLPASRPRFEDGGDGDTCAVTLARDIACALPGMEVIARAIRRESGSCAARAEVTVLANGQATFAALFAQLESARRSIDLEYYIFRDDGIGKRVSEVIGRKAEAGVHVRLLVDGFGSRSWIRKKLPELARHGVDGRVFFPVQFPWLKPTLNHRDHCKIAVVDGVTAFTGGVNIGLEYTGLKPDVGPWRDTHLCLTGDAVGALRTVFDMNWALGTPIQSQPSRQKTQTDVPRPITVTSLRQRRVPAVVRSQLQLEAARELRPARASGAKGDRGVESDGRMQAWVQTVESGPDRPIRATQVLYFLCLTQAVHTIDITTPYFAPDVDLTMAIRAAVARGVRVRLLLPAHSDHPLIGLAGRSYYVELLQVGVQIYLYETGLLHAKVLVVDGGVSVLGATNIDLRSFRLNYEISVVLYGREAAQELTRQFECDLTHARRIGTADVRSDNLLRQLTMRGARLLAPLL